MFGMQVDLEGLAHRVGFDEVALIMHVETVMGCMILQVGDETRDIDDRHCLSLSRLRALVSATDTIAGTTVTPMRNIAALQQLLRDVTETAVTALAGAGDRRADGEREGQYGLDLLVDGPLVQTLLDNGLGVLSEEAGLIEADRPLVAVVDPVDGSTNASRGVSWFATSISVFDDEGPLVALVEDHTTRERFEAVRGSGATRNGVQMGPVTPVPENERIVLLNGIPTGERAWAQYRVLGASALDINYVAAGAVDGYIDFDTEAHGVWDYAGALLVCQEVGVPIVDAFGRDLVHRDIDERRTPVVAQDEEALQRFVEIRQNAEG